MTAAEHNASLLVVGKNSYFCINYRSFCIITEHRCNNTNNELESALMIDAVVFFLIARCGAMTKLVLLPHCRGDSASGCDDSDHCTTLLGNMEFVDQSIFVKANYWLEIFVC